MKAITLCRISKVSPFLFLLCLCSSCKDRLPSGVVSEAKLENILYDYHIARALANDRDSSTFYSHVYFHQILQRYKVSEKNFEKSLIWYNRHTDRFFDIYERINSRLEGEVLSLGAVTTKANMYSNLTAEGDTANIWNGRNLYLLSPIAANNRFTFRVDADSTFLPKDRFQLHFHSVFLFSEGTRDATVCLYLVYDNDSVQQVVSHCSHDREVTVDIYAGERPLKSVNGFIYLKADWSPKSRLLFITSPSLVRFHDQELKRKREHPEPAAQPADTISTATPQLDSLKTDSVRPMLRGERPLRAKPVPLRKKQFAPLRQLQR